MRPRSPQGPAISSGTHRRTRRQLHAPRLLQSEKGQFACKCDQALNTELSSKLKSGELKGAQVPYARSAYHYFKGSPCQGVASGKTGPTKLLQNLYNNGKKKAESLYDKVVGEKVIGEETSPAPATTTPAPAVESSDHAQQASDAGEPHP